jgi:hypothetical protein
MILNLSLVINDAEAEGLLKPNTNSMIFEGTVGSTGISITTVVGVLRFMVEFGRLNCSFLNGGFQHSRPQHGECSDWGMSSHAG